jgi:hypothetical protein
MISRVSPRLRLLVPSVIANERRLREVSQSIHMIAVIHVYDESGNVIETHEHKGEFKDW